MLGEAGRLRQCSAARAGQGAGRASPRQAAGWAHLGLTAPPGGGCPHMPCIRGQKPSPELLWGWGCSLWVRWGALLLGSLLGLVGASLPLATQGFCDAAF